MSTNSPIYIQLVGFTPSTRTLLKSTFTSYARKGRSFSEAVNTEVPSLYLLDGDDIDACSAWRDAHFDHIDAPVVAIGHDPFNLGVPVMAKPLKWSDLYVTLIGAIDLSLPKWPTSHHSSSDTRMRSDTNGNGATLLRKKLLVVDDSATVRHYMTLKLAPFGFAVDYAESGDEAIQKSSTYPYEAVFLDVVMPGLDGYATCKKLRHILPPSTPIVMVTTRDSPFDKMRGTLAGCTAYLIKPMDESAIADVMSKWLKVTVRR